MTRDMLRCIIYSWCDCSFIQNLALFFTPFLKMPKKLSKQLTGEDWTWNNLNMLCLAIGSISWSMMEEQNVNQHCERGGPFASKTSCVKLMRYKGSMIEDMARIFEAVFQCTLENNTCGLSEDCHGDMKERQRQDIQFSITLIVMQQNKSESISKRAINPLCIHFWVFYSFTIQVSNFIDNHGFCLLKENGGCRVALQALSHLQFFMEI
ncbi:uncharacterized protein LOC130760401 [Actinidia eriantha]|uniref:uncharacterized protein LOC130760401 n=1 Tax=Actinidia eriantha TaxID=165200 RepID=UPI002589FF21|nr:uncharacterized protein LOC130760401 [Actinidia eriantha]